MKNTIKQVREALREKQPFAFTYRQLPMCVSPGICGAGICVGNRMFLACTAALIRKVDTNLYQLPARYAGAASQSIQLQQRLLRDRMLHVPGRYDGRPYRDQRNYHFRRSILNTFGS